MTNPKRIASVALLLFAVLLAGCSKDSKDNRGITPSSNDSSHWDKLIWDQDNWA